MSTGQYNRMMLRGALLCVCLTALLCTAGCKNTGKGSGGDVQSNGKVKTAGGKQEKLPELLPFPRMQRNFTDVDDRVRKAWYLVETSYVVVGQKYKAASEMMKSTDPATLRKGAEQKGAVTEEIQKNLFGTNSEVEKLFEDAISAQPENPLNYVSYAVYLLPRKTFQGTGYTEQYDRALQLMDKAIQLWPDEASFYLVKINMMTGSLKVHEWTRNISMEEATIQAKLPDIQKLFDQAEKYDPQNGAINYWRAQLDARLTPTKDFAKIKADVLEQIHKGNSKATGHFAFPPPADPFPEIAQYVELHPEYQDAHYYDCWMNFGFYDLAGQLAIFGGLLPELHWPKDKQTVADLMWMLYNMGRTKPFDTTYFSWQHKILTTLMDDPTIAPADKTQLAQATFMLTDYYTSATQQLAAVPLIFDPTKFDVVGLSEYETQTARQPRQMEIIQPLHASYLHQVADKLGLPPFPLDPDPKNWGN